MPLVSADVPSSVSVVSDGVVELVEAGEGRLLLRLRGDLDVSSQLIHLAAVDQLASMPDLRHVDVDAADVTFIDSSGLHVLLRMVIAHRDSGGTVSTIDASPQFRRLIELSGLTEQFGLPVDPSRL